MNGLYTMKVSDLAKALNISETTLRARCKEGKIPFIYLGDEMRFDYGEVIQFSKKRTKEMLKENKDSKG